MGRRVIYVARQLGTGGADIGRLVADELGYQFVDEEIVQAAAEKQGISVDELTDVERRTSFLDGLLRNLALSGGADSYFVGVSAMGTTWANVFCTRILCAGVM